MRGSRGAKRTDRVAPLVREVISDALLTRSKDPLARRAVVTDVRVSGDLSIATVYFVTMGEEEERDQVMAALERARGFLRREVGQRVRLRVTPELRFRIDTGVDHGRRIEALLSDLRPAEPEEAPEADGGSEE